MNRKLINGLLLLTVATGGVGTFTSCKDNEDSFKQEINETQGQLFKLLDDKIKNGDENLKVVKDKLNALLGAGLLTTENQEFLLDLIQNNKNYSDCLKTYIDEMAISLITNVEIQEVYNPAFGTINLPLGIQNTLLANYYYQSNHPVNFPRVDGTGDVYGDQYAQLALDNAIKAGLAPEGAVTLGTEVQPIDRLGEIYVTINPSNIPEEVINGLDIRLWTSNGKQMLAQSAKLVAVKDDDHLINFGYTRANNNGFYRIEVSASAEDVPSINLNLDDRLKETAKDFAKDPSKSDLLNLAEAIYKQFNNRIPALALSFTPTVEKTFTYQETPWNKEPGGLVIGAVNVTQDANGNDKYESAGGVEGNGGEVDPNAPVDTEISTNFLKLRSIYTRYSIGTVTYHPLSYSFDPEGYVPDRRLPQIGHIQEYVSKVFDKVSFQLNLEGLNPDNYSINLSGVEFTVDPTSMKISLAGLPVYNTNDPTQQTPANVVGVLGADAVITLGYNQPADPSKGVYYQPNALDDFINSIAKAVNDKNDPNSFVQQIQAQVDTQLKSIIGDINDQLKSVNTQITDKIQSIKDQINNELNGRLGDGINRLIDLYNKLAQKVNTILDDPNAYMQVYAAYRDGNGDLHHLSTVKADPSIFTPGTGDAITLFLTSYNGELLAPAYKKYVAVLDKDGKSVAAANAAPYLNKVLEGRQQKTYIPVNALNAGEVYQVVYTALDYRGNVSARSFYIKVAK